MSTSRYKGWTIEKISDAEYFMVRDAGLFAASVRLTEQFGWQASLMTLQSGGTWKPAKTPCVHCAMGVVTEAERRAATIRKYEAKSLTGARACV